MKDYPRSARLSTQIQQELSGLLREGVLRDPRVHDVILTVTAVEVSRDLSSARVLVSWLGDDAKLKDAVKALNHSAGKLRHELGLRLRVRYVPTLHFAADVALREGDRLQALIRQAVASDRHEAKADPDAPAVAPRDDRQD